MLMSKQIIDAPEPSTRHMTTKLSAPVIIANKKYEYETLGNSNDSTTVRCEAIVELKLKDLKESKGDSRA